ncbi:MAG: TonB-dependent receptor [Cellulophaga sp.]|nr:TonB-dependent receptor [Cellulophaga sp.]
MNLKVSFFLFFCTMFQILFGQNKVTTITINFQDIDLKQAIDKIELQSDYIFYYDDLLNNEIKVNKKYINVSLSDLLEDLFKETAINFHIGSDNRIILTKNLFIFNYLPKDFFGIIADSLKSENKKIIPKSDINLVFYNTTKAGTLTIETPVYIGKQEKIAKNKNVTLSGYITDSKTKEPLANVSIVSKTYNMGTSSNDEGYYSISLPPGLHVLNTSAMGTQATERNVIIYQNGSLAITLSENIEELNEVIVKADQFKNIEDTSTGSTTINSEKSKDIPLVLGERNILKVATTLPGVSTAGEGASGFNVRGGKADQNLVLLDHAVLYNPTHFFGIFEALNPFTTDNVTIYKGSVPAEYGGRVSSVFDIRTKDPNTNKFGVELSVGPVTGNIALEVPIVKEKSGLIIGARGTYSDWILQSLDDESLRNSTASFYDIIAKYNHKINEKNEIKTVGYYSKDAFSITSDSLYRYSNRLASLEWSKIFNTKNIGQFLLTNTRYKFEIDYEGVSNDNFTLGYQINETEFKTIINHYYNTKHKFTYGLSTKLYTIAPGNISPNGNNSIVVPLVLAQEMALESALFFADNYTFNEKLLFDVGFRLSMFSSIGPSEQRIYDSNLPKSENSLEETISKNRGEFYQTYIGPEFRIASRYLLDPTLSLKASLSTNYQFIHAISNNTTVSPVDTYKLSDNNIKPQKSTQFAAGIFKNFEANTYEISLESYYKILDNTLDFKTGANLFLNETIETELLQGVGKAYGAEFLIRKNDGKLNGWLGYTFSRSLFKFDSEFVDNRVNNGAFFPSNFDTPHNFNIVANYKINQRFSISSNYTYKTGRPVTFPVGKYFFDNTEYVLYSNRNQFRIPDYYRLDVSINVEGNHKKRKLAHSFWSLSVYNLLGRNNPYSVFFVNNDGKIKALQSSIFAIPIPSLTYSLKF